jgi:hypothetical protein
MSREPLRIGIFPRTLLIVALAAWLCPCPAHAVEALGTWGARLSSPQIFSASLGVLIGRIDPPQDDSDDGGTHLPTGVLIQIEPGLGGGKFSLGVAKGLLPMAGAGIKASIMRTWGHPLFTEPRQTYVGVEVDATFFIKLSLGGMARLRGNETAPRLILTGGVGLGF